ncbi:MAG TPA: SDR family oxidoreductase [Alphaproteobacteria bacterium]|nr:SDR family oxidoreductase [Alphaproteobacteria bacterium]HIM11300.1 SDR family oxidoreductase [Candidatus Poribacteria bacterium]HIN91967.1 SDR family oxidoreductase [Alphaproteobacteria bacterium]
MESTKVAIVTAAGKGIGAACAQELAGRGFKVALMSPSGSAVDLAKQLKGIGINGSVTNRDDLSQLVNLALSTYGRVDVVVNNTGKDGESIEASGPGYDPNLTRELIDIVDGSWELGFHLYLMNVVRMARIVTPVFRDLGGGAIVNISTFAALEPRLMFPVSSTLRSALSGYTKLYADRYARDGIRMNNILPGFVENWPLADEVRHSIPSARSVKLKEVASTVAFLLSSEAGSITGQNILVDGGINRSI